MRARVKENWKNVLLIEIVTIFWSIIFLRSLPWKNMSLTPVKVLILSALILFFVGVIPILFIVIPYLNGKVSDCRMSILRAFQYSKENTGKLVKKLLSYIVVTAIAFLLYVFIFRLFLHTDWNSHAFLAVWSGLLILNTLFLMRDNLVVQKTEIAFTITCLILGSLFIAVTPETVGYSPDDQIHYSHTMLVSNAIGGVINSADKRQGTDEEAINIVTNKIGIDRKSRSQYSSAQNQKYKEGVYTELEGGVSYWIVSYIPSAIGIILGRGLGLSWTATFALGRFFNLIIYICIFYYSIKVVSYGKMFLSVLGLTPGLLVLACNYSYDGWVISFIVLGCTLLEKQLQEEKLVDAKEWISMLVAFVLGCLPKAVYFPVMFPILFVPHRKFPTKKKELFLKGLVVVAAFLLLCSFMTPTLSHGVGAGDMRGGTEVNSEAQMAFILTEPIAFLKILVRFILHYVSIDVSGPGLTSYYYFGNGSFPYLVIVMLFIVAFLDRPSIGANTIMIRIASWVGILGALILVCTALYVSFTPVKFETINGVQARYLFPLLFMGLYSLGPDGVKIGKNKNDIYIIGFLLISFVFIRDLYQVCIYAY